MITVKTDSGSEYLLEWDAGCLHVTKTKGMPTARQTPGKMLLNTDEPVVGERYLMHWGWNDDGSANCTLTSTVTEVRREDA